MGGLTQPISPLPNFAAESSFSYDFNIATTINNPEWVSVISGGTTSTITPEAGAMGIWRLLRGITAANRAAMVNRLTQSASGMLSCDNGSVYFEWRVRIPILSDATDRFGCNAGLGSGNAGTSATPGSSIHFRQIDDEAGGNWQCITRASGAQNILDSGVPPVANTWQILSCLVNPLGTLAQFFIDGLRVAETNLEIPTYTGGQIVGPFFALFGGLGVNDRHFDADWLKLGKGFSPARYP